MHIIQILPQGASQSKQKVGWLGSQDLLFSLLNRPPLQMCSQMNFNLVITFLPPCLLSWKLQQKATR